MERPILMSAPMVRAILSGAKTQTRRVVKPRKDMGFGCPLAPNEIAGEINNGDYTNSVYGQPGERLWVREAWRTDMAYDPYSPAQIDSGASLFYLADDKASRVNHHPECGPHQWGRYRPGMFMPRWASRINLEITAVRVKLLQDISEQDARSEGAESADYATGRKCILEPDKGSYRLHYRSIWEQINGAGSWDANPWVWVVEFKRVSP